MLKAAKERKEKNELIIKQLIENFGHLVHFVQNEMKVVDRVSVNTLLLNTHLKNKIFEETQLFSKKYYGKHKNAWSYYTTPEIVDFLSKFE